MPTESPTQLTTPSYIRTCSGANLFYRDWGSGAPILFLAGWALPSDFWGYQMASLSETGYRCLAYDRRGHGRSSDPGKGFDYDSLADDLHEFIEALSLSDLTIVAHSMGAGESVRYISRHGHRRIRQLVWLAPLLPFLTKTPDNPFGVDAGALEEVRRAFVAKGYPTWLEENSGPFVMPDTPLAMVTWIKSLMTPCSFRAVLECNRAATATDFRDELGKVDLPTLIIHGTRDFSAPLEITSRRLPSLMPMARLEIYEDAPHGFPVTHSDRLHADLRDLMSARAPMDKKGLVSRGAGVTK